MNSAIVTEDPTDYNFIQYYMCKVCSWNDYQESSLRRADRQIKARELKKNKKLLTIISSGGCTRIPDRLDLLLKNNSDSSSRKEVFNKIVIVSDNDDESAGGKIESAIENVVQKYAIHKSVKIQNRKWLLFKMHNSLKEVISVKLLLLLIPFDEKGAIETFLLGAIADKDEYDKQIIEKGNDFVENVDSEQRYLKHRRDKVKAKMDVYFSIRTSAEQFVERRNILKNIEWEKYEKIQICFSELRKL